MYGSTQTYPRPLVRRPRLLHSFRVLQLIHVTLELLDIVLQLPVLAQLLPQNLHERLERRLWRSTLVLPPSGCVEG